MASVLNGVFDNFNFSMLYTSFLNFVRLCRALTIELDARTHALSFLRTSCMPSTISFNTWSQRIISHCLNSLNSLIVFSCEILWQGLRHDPISHGRSDPLCLIENVHELIQSTVRLTGLCFLHVAIRCPLCETQTRSMTNRFVHGSRSWEQR